MFCDYFYGSQSESFSFFRIPRELIKGERFKKLSTDAKLLYGLLLDRMSLSAKNGWYDELDRIYIYYTVEEISEDIGCSSGKACRLLAELDIAKGIGLIERKKQGQGKPTIIYVKQFIVHEPTKPQEHSAETRMSKTESLDYPNRKGKTVQNENSRHTKSESADIPKPEANYNNKNYTETSYTDPSIFPENVIEEIKEQIDFEMLCQYYPYDDPDCIVELICEVLCSTAPSIKIGNETMPLSKVQSRFRKLSFDHVAYVLDAFKECTSKIHNIRAYLLTALYNAPLTIGPYYSNAIRYDTAQKLFSP